MRLIYISRDSCLRRNDKENEEAIMISVENALQTILNSTQDFGVEEIPLMQSVGRILKEDIFADRDFPPFNRVAMDGIAIDFQKFQHGQRTFKIEGIQAAGSEQITLQNLENCIEVMTGAVLPKKVTAVIRYEDVAIKNGIATLQLKTINEGQNIHEQGKDKQQGDVLISQNTKISAVEIGVLATVGKSLVKVARQPKVMIVSTGDELVEVAQNALAAAIHDIDEDQQGGGQQTARYNRYMDPGQGGARP